MAGGHLVLIGDFNMPGKSAKDIDERLSTWLSCFNLAAVNDEPTHRHSNGSESRLDVIIEPENGRRVSSVTVIPVCYSDHRLVKATLDCARPHLVKATLDCARPSAPRST